MSQDRDTPVNPGENWPASPRALGPDVLDTALRETGAHRAHTGELARLGDSIRGYARAQLVGYGVIAVVLAIMAWRSERAAARQDAFNAEARSHWAVVDARLTALEARP